MTTMVTPGYAPLEQYGQAVRFGAFTDIYALAATLYHLLTGQMPAPATDRASGVELKSPREVNHQVSQTVSDAVMWALEMRVDRRPQTVHAFLDALTRRTWTVPPEIVSTPAEEPQDISQPAPPDFHWGIPDPAERVYEVAIPSDEVRWPQRCACCFAPADTSYQLESMGTTGLFDLFVERWSWPVPYCSTCLEHVQMDASHSQNGPGGIAAAAPLAGLVLGGPLGMLIGMGGAAIATALGTAKHHQDLTSKVTPRCVAVGPTVTYLGRFEDGHVFQFLNREFADAFARENA
jgi:hypothetical protein